MTTTPARLSRLAESKRAGNTENRDTIGASPSVYECRPNDSVNPPPTILWILSGQSSEICNYTSGLTSQSRNANSGGFARAEAFTGVGAAINFI